MESLAQTTLPTTQGVSQRNRRVGWLTIASGVALLIVSEAPYFPPGAALVLLLASLVFFLGMIPVAIWTQNGVSARATEMTSGRTRIAEYVGIAGMLIAALVALLALPHWLSPVPAQILNTSATGVIGIWLLAANVVAFRIRLLNRVLAVLGALAGLGWLLSAVVMWIEIGIGNLGSLVATAETVRQLGTYLGEAMYIIWALWLGIWLLVRRR